MSDICFVKGIWIKISRTADKKKQTALIYNIAFNPKKENRSPPKTGPSIFARELTIVPMTDEVKKCFRKIIENRKKPKTEPMIDGKVGFLYLDKNDMPKVTPHVCRHTFCSNMAKSGMNPKTLQKIMGHSDIGVTPNTYTHVGFEDIQKEMKKICS